MHRLVLVADVGSGFARALARHPADLCPQSVDQKAASKQKKLNEFFCLSKAPT